MSDDAIYILKQRKGLSSLFGLIKKQKEIFIIDDNYFYYNSRLGNIGIINCDWIAFINTCNLFNQECVSIGIKDKNKTSFKYKMNAFNQKLSESFLNHTEAEIVITQSEIPMSSKEFVILLKSKLNK
ncbi:hypothetical protein [Lacinutrix jangbogonensis]|uniref:hypothetical protein n=1 Tax=Lacinutrix jangbogonensis TaxID=1469557 RepID=UPI00053E9F4D|nr:hypothetical protein [Lacinutrix jangbogonensis]